MIQLVNMGDDCFLKNILMEGLMLHWAKFMLKLVPFIISELEKAWIWPDGHHFDHLSCKWQRANSYKFDASWDYHHRATLHTKCWKHVTSSFSRIFYLFAFQNTEVRLLSIYPNPVLLCFLHTWFLWEKKTYHYYHAYTKGGQTSSKDMNLFHLFP